MNHGPTTVGGCHSQPQTISSDTAKAPARRGTTHSIGVKQKSSIAFKLVTEATMEGSDKLDAGLKEINDTSKELKKEEIALGMRIHEDNLRYK